MSEPLTFTEAEELLMNGAGLEAWQADRQVEQVAAQLQRLQQQLEQVRAIAIAKAGRVDGMVEAILVSKRTNPRSYRARFDPETHRLIIEPLEGATGRTSTGESEPTR